MGGRETYWMWRHGPVSASVSEAGERSDSAKRAMLLTVQDCSGMDSWWQQIDISGVEGARKRNMYGGAQGRLVGRQPNL